MNINLNKYMEYFRYHLKSPFIPGICGRIIRGKTSADFLTLTDDPSRKLVMLMGPDGLNSILGLSGYKMLETIGYETEYIKRKVDEGCQFKLVVFPEGTPKLATWDNTVDVVGSVYTAIAKDLRDNLQGLKSFSPMNMKMSVPWSDIDKAGESHPDYMTYERYLNSNRSLVATRAFLYFTVHLRELFSGDGYTYTPQGDRGLMEYIVPNLPLASLGEYLMSDIEVKLP